MSQPRKTLTVKEKFDILRANDKERLSVRDLAKKYKIGKTQASMILKNRSIIEAKFYSNTNMNEKRRFLTDKGVKIDSLCYEWFTKARNKGIPISGNFFFKLSVFLATNFVCRHNNSGKGKRICYVHGSYRIFSVIWLARKV